MIGNQYRQTNLGNTVTLERPVGVVNAADLQRPATFRSIVQADLLKEYPESAEQQIPGSWVVAIDAQVSGQPVAGAYAPIIVQIVAGAGGTTHVFEVDPWQAIVPVPTGYVDVRVAWDPNGIVVQPGAAVDDIPLPDSVEITATLQRSFAAGFATRTIGYQFQNGLQTVSQFKIPNFAASYTAFGNRGKFAEQQTFLSGPVPNDEGSILVLSATDPNSFITGQIVDSIQEPDLWATQVLNACTRELPAVADTMNIRPGLTAGAILSNGITYNFRFNLAFR